LCDDPTNPFLCKAGWDMSDTFLEVRDISKSYEGVQALKDVSMSIGAGEVHCLVGENGSGKSTLIKIIGGVVEPDAGSIVIQGKPHPNLQAIDAIREGIQIIYQDLSLVPNLSVAENISLNQLVERKASLVNWREVREIATRGLESIEEKIDPNEIVDNLPVAKRQIVAIARSLTQNAKLIIMDEPTSSLSEKEVRSLFRQIEILKSKGITILYITHKLEEIFEIGDNVTVLRDGKVVGTRAVADIDKGQLIEMMIGRKLEIFFPAIEVRQGRPVLQLEGLTSGKGRFKDVSFTLYDGEILGLYGLVGAGRTELAEAIFGVDREYEGTLRFNGQVIQPESPQGAMDLGIAYLPENRQLEGLVLKMDIANNITLAILKEITRRGFVRKKLELQRAASSIESMRIVCTGSEQTVENLSGGNQQKVLVGKWLNLRPKVLILDEPTHGIDVATKAEVYHLMRTLVEQGTPILLISSELPEIIGMSSRILVMGAGAIRGEFRRNEWTREKIIEAALAG